MIMLIIYLWLSINVILFLVAIYKGGKIFRRLMEREKSFNKKQKEREEQLIKI